MIASLLLLELETRSGTPKGDCTIPGFEGHIMLESFRWELTNSTKVAQNNVSRVLKPGKVRLSKPYDRSSTALARLMELDLTRSDVHFQRATLKFVDPTTDRGATDARLETIMELELTDGFIDEIRVRVSEQRRMVSVKEDIVLSFKTAVSLRYHAESSDGRRTAMPPFRYVLPTP